MTYTIPRYPVHLIDVVQVGDGSRVTIRPSLPQDVELQRAFFRTLSAESRYCRFMTQLNELPDRQRRSRGGQTLLQSRERGIFAARPDGVTGACR